MKKFYLMVCVVVVCVLAACSPQKKEGDIDSHIYTLESDFKQNYQLWVDMKADGSIQYKEYALDLKTVGNKFKSLGNTAKTKSYADLLSKEDQEIYEVYRLLGDKIYSMGYALYYDKKEDAKRLYQEILDTEENLKE